MIEIEIKQTVHPGCMTGITVRHKRGCGPRQLLVAKPLVCFFIGSSHYFFTSYTNHYVPLYFYIFIVVICCIDLTDHKLKLLFP